MGLSGNSARSGVPQVFQNEYTNSLRRGKTTELSIEASGIDGALANLSPIPEGVENVVLADIHWKLHLKIDCDLDPLQPRVEFRGVHDTYPAYEIIVLQSNGSFKDIHRYSPAPDVLPGPFLLANFNAINVGRIDIIKE